MLNDIVINLNSGDLVFCNGVPDRVFYDTNTSNTYQSGRSYNHVGIVIRDPVLKDFSAKGVYVLEVDNPDSGFKTRAVLRKIDDVLRRHLRVDVRCWKTLSEARKLRLRQVYKNVTKSPYENTCCLGRCFSCFRRVRESQFFYSAELVASALRTMNLIDAGINPEYVTIRQIAELTNKDLSPISTFF